VFSDEARIPYIIVPSYHTTLRSFLRYRSRRVACQLIERAHAQHDVGPLIQPSTHDGPSGYHRRDHARLYCEDVQLDDNLTEDEIIHVALQLAMAINHLHNQGVFINYLSSAQIAIQRPNIMKVLMSGSVMMPTVLNNLIMSYLDDNDVCMTPFDNLLYQTHLNMKLWRIDP
jgi:hypothetical protein